MKRLSVLAVLFWLGGCATYVATSGGVVIENDGGAALSAADRTAIREYYKGTAARPLPAGVAVQKRLPRGVTAHPLPAALERRLSPVPPGCRRAHIGGDVLLIDTRSGVVLDIASGN